ncbi:hypothetical protein BU14_2782s0001, partial [Porphyra umbilicalis]
GGATPQAAAPPPATGAVVWNKSWPRAAAGKAAPRPPQGVAHGFPRPPRAAGRHTTRPLAAVAAAAARATRAHDAAPAGRRRPWTVFLGADGAPAATTRGRGRPARGPSPPAGRPPPRAVGRPARGPSPPRSGGLRPAGPVRHPRLVRGAGGPDRLLAARRRADRVRPRDPSGGREARRRRAARAGALGPPRQRRWGRVLPLPVRPPLSLLAAAARLAVAARLADGPLPAAPTVPYLDVADGVSGGGPPGRHAAPSPQPRYCIRRAPACRRCRRRRGEPPDRRGGALAMAPTGVAAAAAGAGATSGPRILVVYVVAAGLLSPDAGGHAKPSPHLGASVGGCRRAQTRGTTGAGATSERRGVLVLWVTHHAARRRRGGRRRERAALMAN